MALHFFVDIFLSENIDDYDNDEDDNNSSDILIIYGVYQHKRSIVSSCQIVFKQFYNFKVV